MMKTDTKIRKQETKGKKKKLPKIIREKYHMHFPNLLYISA